LTHSITGTTTGTRAVAFIIGVKVLGHQGARTDVARQVAGLTQLTALGVTANAVNAHVADALGIGRAGLAVGFLVLANVAAAPVARLAIGMGAAGTVALTRSVTPVLTASQLRVGAGTMCHTLAFRAGNVALLARTATGLLTTHAIGAEVALTLVAAAAGVAQIFLGLADRRITPVTGNAIAIGSTGKTAYHAVALVGRTVEQAAINADADAIAFVRMLHYATGATLSNTDGLREPQSTLTTTITLSVNAAGFGRHLLTLIERIQTGCHLIAGTVAVAHITQRAVVFRI
jgi:hypothetical protein